MIEHIRDDLREFWSEAEELRFQFSVATTLAHEVTHVFWFNTLQHCWTCFSEDPYWHKDEDTFGPAQEIGNSWEYWAFGSRVPVGVRLVPQDSEYEDNGFQRCQWSYIWSTEQAGRLNHLILDHDYVLPVQYISDWFQESTWRRIKILGRVAGRPNHSQVVIMREEPCDVDAKDKFDTYECTVEPYDFAQLIALGGFAEPRASRLAYGTKFENSTKIKKFKKDLIAKRVVRNATGALP